VPASSGAAGRHVVQTWRVGCECNLSCLNHWPPVGQPCTAQTTHSVQDPQHSHRFISCACYSHVSRCNRSPDLNITRGIHHAAGPKDRLQRTAHCTPEHQQQHRHKQVPKCFGSRHALTPPAPILAPPPTPPAHQGSCPLPAHTPQAAGAVRAAEWEVCCSGSRERGAFVCGGAVCMRVCSLHHAGHTCM
jgi:hypothetical protein